MNQPIETIEDAKAYLSTYIASIDAEIASKQAGAIADQQIQPSFIPDNVVSIFTPKGNQ